jgi:ankyrin repeat protein
MSAEQWMLFTFFIMSWLNRSKFYNIIYIKYNLTFFAKLHVNNHIINNKKEFYMALSDLEREFHEACKFGKVARVAELLKDPNLDVNSLEYSSTPLHKACEKGRIEVVELLLNSDIE